MKLAVAGPREAGRRASFLLDRTGETVLHVTDWSFLLRLAFLFSPKAFVGVSILFSLRPDFLYRFRAALITILGSECFQCFSLEVEEMQERDGRSPSWIFYLCVLVPFFKGGAKNLTVKSILWRGSAYRFLPCPFTVKLKKDQKKLEEEGHACLQSVGRGVWPNVASCLACGSRGEFIYLV